ncbi:MAG: peroxiredoxin family protein [Thermogutta sp.]
MQPTHLFWERILLVVVLGVVLMTGCSRKRGAQGPQKDGATKAVSSQAVLNTEPAEAIGPASPVAEAAPAVPPQNGDQPREIPKVVMAEIDRAKCKLFVGDAAPNVELVAFSGDKQQIRDLFGAKGTVLVFWHSSADRYANMNAANMLSDLEADVYKRFKDKGVSVVGIHVGPNSSEAKKIIDDSAVSFPNLVDENGEFFRQFSDQQPPCLYVLDHSGTIVWLDIEYTRAVREAMKQAAAALAE